MPHLALVTGSAKRLGREIALRLAAEGCDVVVHYRSSAEEADATVADISELGVKTAAVGFDQSAPEEIDAGFAKILGIFGRAPDVLVNSASMFVWDDIETVERKGLETHFAANVVGPVLLTQKVFAASSEETRGLVLNMLDQKLFNPNPDHVSYTLTKYALQGFTEMMARRLAPRFRVNAIAPGYTLPDVDAGGSEHYEATRHDTPLERGPSPSDIADAAAYLLNAKATTGQTILVDGGAHIRPAERNFTQG